MEVQKFHATATECEAFESLLSKFQSINARDSIITKEVRSRLGLSDSDKISFDATTGTFIVMTVGKPVETPKS